MNKALSLLLVLGVLSSPMLEIAHAVPTPTPSPGPVVTPSPTPAPVQPIDGCPLPNASHFVSLAGTGIGSPFLNHGVFSWRFTNLSAYFTEPNFVCNSCGQLHPAHCHAGPVVACARSYVCTCPFHVNISECPPTSLVGGEEVFKGSLRLTGSMAATDNHFQNVDVAVPVHVPTRRVYHLITEPIIMTSPPELTAIVKSAELVAEQTVITLNVTANEFWFYNVTGCSVGSLVAGVVRTGNRLQLSMPACPVVGNLTCGLWLWTNGTPPRKDGISANIATPSDFCEVIVDPPDVSMTTASEIVLGDDHTLLVESETSLPHTVTVERLLALNNDGTSVVAIEDGAAVVNDYVNITGIAGGVVSFKVTEDWIWRRLQFQATVVIQLVAADGGRRVIRTLISNNIQTLSSTTTGSVVVTTPLNRVRSSNAGPSPTPAPVPTPPPPEQVSTAGDNNMVAILAVGAVAAAALVFAVVQNVRARRSASQFQPPTRGEVELEKGISDKELHATV